MTCLIRLARPLAFWYSDFLPPGNLDMKRYNEYGKKNVFRQTKP